MRSHLNGIDHCCVLVRDFDRARDTFTLLGFTVSPFGRHATEMGTGNHNVLFEQDYFELLGVREPTEYNEDIRDALSVREGIAAVAVRTDDTAAAAAEWQAAGLTTTEPQTVRRPVELPDGTESEAVFSIARLTDVTGYLQLFSSQILTPEHTWISELMKHPNTAWGIDHIAIVAEDAETSAANVARVFETEPEAHTTGTIEVPTGGSPIIYLSPSSFKATYPGIDRPPTGLTVLAVKVFDENTAAAHLRTSNVPFTTTERGLVVAPEHANGILLVLRAATHTGEDA
ncbi:VOC family protein [Amycolatopsis sp. NPDC005232]|uniref:VOC family protein n=1 Tax=Amycolatopsis sp. NPDC005232 TaxID=3157027 RepID=UPI0033A7DA64